MRIGHAAMNKIIVCALMILLPLTATKVSANEKDIVIVIDPGHGGDDCGAISPYTGVRESECNYAIAKAMYEELQKYRGVKVYYTRPENMYMTNMGRAVAAAELEADFVISIHNNSEPTNVSQGCTVYKSLRPKQIGITEKMGEMILEEITQTGLVDAGVKYRASTKYPGEDYYTLIAESARMDIPAVIIEHCFLSNESDANYISNTDGSVNLENATALGRADARAVARYFDLKAKTDDIISVGKQKHEAIALVCGINPSFYSESSPIKDIDLSQIIAYVVNEDCSYEAVKPDYIGPIDFSQIGIQDIEVRYKNLKGYLRICNETKEYCPQSQVLLKPVIEPEPTSESNDYSEIYTNETAVMENTQSIAPSRLFIVIASVMLAIGIPVFVIAKRHT